jgi:hypothetical protein
MWNFFFWIFFGLLRLQKGITKKARQCRMTSYADETGAKLASQRVEQAFGVRKKTWKGGGGKQ